MMIIERCPCCGDYAFLMRNNSSIFQDFDLPTWYVQCHGCGIRTMKGEKEEVITTWNRRVNNEIYNQDTEAQMD